MTKITKPIIVIGAERSGKTLLFSLLANHPRLYWLSNLDTVWPSGTIPVTLARRVFSLTMLRRSYQVVPGTRSRLDGVFPPSECVAYWKRLFKWGSEESYLIEDDHFDETDLTAELAQQFVRDLSLRLSLAGKSRLGMEQAGFSLKIRFFDALFPDALFIHAIRDPFENHEALVRVKLASSQKFWGVKIPGWKDLIGLDLGTQAALQLKSILHIIDEDIARIPGSETRFLRVRREDLLATPQETIEAVLKFCDLDATPRVLAALSGIQVDPAYYRDRSHIDSQETLDVLNALAREYGYPESRILPAQRLRSLGAFP